MNSSDHIIKSYDSELIRLTGEIVRMGELSVTQREAAIDVIERRDERAAQRVVGNDDALDQLEQDISHDVVRLLALRAPMAGDLRNVFAALRIAADIERIGDYAANVAKRSIPLSMVAPISPTKGLGHLAELAATEVRDVLKAYHDQDAERAYQVWKDDAELDEAYTGYFRQLLTYMMEDPRNITRTRSRSISATSRISPSDHGVGAVVAARRPGLSPPGQLVPFLTGLATHVGGMHHAKDPNDDPGQLHQKCRPVDRSLSERK
jgi:phosphate transport system protein